MKIDIQYRLARWFERTVWLFLFLHILVLCAGKAFAQQSDVVETERIMFYNVENVFWPEDDPLREDEEFTPEGSRYWSFNRLRAKLNHLTRVILAAGGGRVPMVVGLAEVEGDSVMHYWTHRTTLRRTGYQYVVTDGPDVRGIQMALLYHPASFKLLHHDAHTIALPEDERPTRQLLHAAGRLVTGDTLDIIVAHLPSRSGGVAQTQQKRDIAHTALLHLADSISAARQHPCVVMMGDMNEAPQRHVETSSATLLTTSQAPVAFTNLMYPLYKEMVNTPGAFGTHKYHGEWDLIDHFIVHPTLLDSTQSICLKSPRIFHLPFMMTEDTSNQGVRPFRTYYGYHYEGGYSDHLPIVVDLKITK